MMKSTSPTFTLLTSLHHSFLSFRDVSYSLCQRFQKCRSMFWMCAHLDAEVQLAKSFFFGVSTVGQVSSLVPLNKYAVVKNSPSFGTSDITPIGREFNIFSTWQNKVVNSSNVRTWFPIVRLKWCFALFIPASHKPPKWGALGNIKFHSIKRPAAAACKETWYFALKIFCNFPSSDCEPVKFVALSEYNFLGQPRRDVKRRNAAIQEFVVRSDTSSKCIALLAKQTKNANRPLCFQIPVLLDKKTTKI